jgi:hypothetical protein
VLREGVCVRVQVRAPRRMIWASVDAAGRPHISAKKSKAVKSDVLAVP